MMNSQTSPGTRRLAFVAGWSLCLLLLLAGTGCKKSNNASVVDTKIFESAPAELKQAWNQALSAAGSNDYATAYLTLLDLQRQPGLEEAQYKAIAAESTAVNTRMTEAAQKGNANALQAIQDIRAASRTRGR